MENHDPVDLSEAIETYGLARHIAELDETGLTVVPQSTLGLDDGWFEQLRDSILRVAKARTGVTFDPVSYTHLTLPTTPYV